MSIESRGHQFRWTGEMAHPERTDSMEMAITIARDLRIKASNILDSSKHARGVGLEEAASSIFETALNLLYRNSADAIDVAGALSGVALAYEQAGDNESGYKSAALAHSTYSLLPESYVTQQLIHQLELLMSRTAPKDRAV